MAKGMNRLELFAAQNRLSPYVSNELLARIASPIKFRVGNNTAHGFDSDVLSGRSRALPLQSLQVGRRRIQRHRPIAFLRTPPEHPII